MEGLGINRVIRFGVAIMVILVLLMLLLSRQVMASVANIERLSLGSNGLESDASSFHAYLSQHARYAVFESYATNWAPDQDGSDRCYGNCTDIFLRDRQMDKTIKITVGHDGSPTDDDSFHPMITAGGRYILFNSYATNLVPGDTNRDVWLRDGLDVFLYDTQTSQIQRVSLTWDGRQIWGNSAGVISGNGQHIFFASNGFEIIQGEGNSQRIANIYHRDWQTGSIERITADMNTAGFPNGAVGGPETDYAGRYLVYISSATNLTPGDTNGYTDVLLYDRNTGETIVISKPFGGGQSNGDSSPASISADGRFVIFKSEATNLVSGDTNNWSDIFVYTVATGEIRRVNVTSTGKQANGFSRDASICGDGSVVSFSSDATNLVPGDTNGRRDVFFRDLNREQTSVATINSVGAWGNGKAHRSILAPDCRTIAYASDADNVVADDHNNVRDLFLAQITWPADFGQTSQAYVGIGVPGEVINYEYTIRNSGTESAVATVISPIPANVTFVPNSESAGAVYDPGANRVEWSRVLDGGSEISFSYSVTIDSSLTEFTMITNQTTLSGDGKTRLLISRTVVNGLHFYLPTVVSN